MPVRNPARALGVVLLAAVPGAVIGYVVARLLRAAGTAVPTWYLILLSIAACCLVALGKSLLRELEVPLPTVAGRTPPGDPPPSVLTPLERSLSAAARDRRLFELGLQPALYQLARERLRLHHALDLDPDSVRHALGEELWHWLRSTRPDGPPPTPQQLETLISRIAQL
jgi:hypothetical protein